MLPKEFPGWGSGLVLRKRLLVSLDRLGT